MKNGFVALVGAGPGDVNLLTLKGKEFIEKAEVVVYDRLVSQDILNLIPHNAEKIDVGKKSSMHLVAQDKINEILLKKAMEGKYTVRLKGGDPYMFGRGGEELELLVENNVPFEVVPGITSAIAAPSYSGIPVTHRDFCSSVHIITGHQKNNEPLKINFAALNDLKGTLVFLMGVASLDAISKGLLNVGMSKDMPAAVIQNGTRSNQKKVVATLESITYAAREIESPAVIVVGEVCSLSNNYDWFSKLPLYNKKVVVTRPLASGGTLSQKLKALGAEVLECPVTQIVEIGDNTNLDKELSNLSNYEWIVFTSKNGVEIFFDKLMKLNKDVRCLGHLKFGVIGSQTKASLLQKGINADFMPQVYDATNLAQGLCEVCKPQDRFLLLRAREGSEELTKILGQNNKEHTDLPIYDTIYIDDAKEDLQGIDTQKEMIVTFTSASTVEGFCKLYKTTDNILGVCIGNQTAQAAIKHGIKHVISKTATIDSLIEKIMEVINE